MEQRYYSNEVTLLGKQKIDSKVRQLTPDSRVANINDKFQITTSIEFNSEIGIPCSPKIVNLLILNV